MALLNETHIARNAPHGATVVQDGRYLPPPEDKDGKIWVRTSAIIQAHPISFMQSGEILSLPRSGRSS